MAWLGLGLGLALALGLGLRLGLRLGLGLGIGLGLGLEQGEVVRGRALVQARVQPLHVRRLAVGVGLVDEGPLRVDARAEQPW